MPRASGRYQHIGRPTYPLYNAELGTLQDEIEDEPPDDEARAALRREMADALGMLLLLARSEGVDLDAAVQEKWLSWLDKPVSA